MSTKGTLFEGFVILVVLSDELQEPESDVLLSGLSENGAEISSKWNHDVSNLLDIDGSGKIPQITHIISTNIDFKEFQLADAYMIPVVRPEWVLESIEKRRLLSYKPYSPDPKLFFSDIFVCVGDDLPEGDKEAIYGGVRAMGGQFFDSLTKFTTHLVTKDIKGEKSIVVESCDIPIKIVLPHWIDDCLKLRRRIDEKDYLLPETAILSKDYIGSISQSAELDTTTQYNSQLLYEESTQIPKFLADKRFYLGSDLELSTHSRAFFRELIQTAGGEVIGRNLSISERNVDVYIGQYRDGIEFSQATKSNLYIGNMDWIYWMIAHDKWILPTTKLLHYPFVRNGLSDFRDFVIGATNYTGESRFYLERLAEALGAKFTKNLKESNTHLICAKSMGKKYGAAVKWGVKVVNHLWLEESYSKWTKQDELNPRYNHFANGTHLENVIGRTQLDTNVLKAWYKSGTENDGNKTDVVDDSMDEGGDGVFGENKMSQNEEPEDNVDISRATTPAVSIEANSSSSSTKTTPPKKDEMLGDSEIPEVSIKNQSARKKRIAEETESKTPNGKKKKTESETPTTKKTREPSTPVAEYMPRRAASVKAFNAIHASVEDMNLFQKQSKSKSKNAPMLPIEIEAKKKEKELKEKSIDEIKEERKVSSPAHASSSPIDYDIHAVTTGCDDLTKAQIQLLSKVGITFESRDSTKCNTIFAPRVMRTEKFLIGLSIGPKYILHPEFLNDVLKKLESDEEDDEVVEPETYSLDVYDKQFSKETSISFDQLISKANERYTNKNPIFKNVQINLASEIPGGANVISKILAAHGVEKVKVINNSVGSFKGFVSFESEGKTQVIFVSKKGSNPKQIEKVKKVLNKENCVANVVDWDWVVKSILSMEILPFDEYVI